MPSLTLVICVHEERALLDRLLRQVEGCYDELIVIHDGAERAAKSQSIEELVTKSGGRFFVRPRSFQQEPHWPFAWKQASHSWILRLDADEAPSVELKNWLRSFRSATEPNENISGYSCIWPLWNGQRFVTKRWPAGRLFLFHKERIRFFGMAEQTPVADGHFEALPFVLEHRPLRKSYGLANLLFRPQAFRWRRIIAQALLGKPSDLECWRWTSEDWPQVWEEIRRHPLRTAFYRLLIWPLRGVRDYWHYEHRLIPSAAISGGVHHCLIALEHWWTRLASPRS